MAQHGALYPSLSSRILIIIATTLLLNTIIFTHLLAHAYTNPSDVGALEILYSALSNPTKLPGWQPSGGDPCGDRWKGIKCQDSAVVMIELSGLGLNGTMGYSLADLSSLMKLDLSMNRIHETIPYQLPPNLIDLNLAYNNITGNLPYSISSMTSLNIINVSHNSLNQKIDDIYGNLASLSTLDISFNSLIGHLPNSFTALSNISSIYVQNNQLNGSLGVLSDLPLANLNVANNHFTGRVPIKLSSIPNFIYDGNLLDNDPAFPSFPPPPSGGSNHNHPGPSTHLRADSAKTNKKLSIGFVVGIILACTFVVLGIVLVLLFCVRRKSSKANSGALVGNFALGSERVNTEMQEQRVQSIANLEGVKPTTADGLMVERIQENAGSLKRDWSPITVTSFTVATLQIATNSFSQDFLIGEGSLGRVYKAEFPNGKTMAVKKMDNAALPLQEEEKFLEAVSSMSHLRHPNIVALAGYCAEHGQRLLVYEHIKNGNLHDMLHCFDKSRALPWNARVRITLGIARALEYLHEVCTPYIVHRNFKSANILLDEELNPHLSDCGVVAFRPNTERQLSTEMVGQFGYSAPEFAMSGIYTVKSDVYSFGVVMLELLTSRKPLDSSRVRSEQSLVRWATPQLHDIDALAKMVDPALNGMYPAKSLSRFADIIALCVQPEPEFRPPMSEVVQALIRLVQRASILSRRSSEDSGFAYRNLDHDAVDMGL